MWFDWFEEVETEMSDVDDAGDRFRFKPLLERQWSK
jgi:hypothetical protein